MNLELEFIRFTKRFSASAPVTTASLTAQRAHARRVMEWFELISRLEVIKNRRKQEIRDTLQAAMDSATALFDKGDDISAWVGQMRIAEIAGKLCPGELAAHHFAAAARFSVFLHLFDYGERLLQRMLPHMRETDNAMRTQFWHIKGLIHQLQRNWMDAIPSFQRALEYLDYASQKELNDWLMHRRETPAVNRMILIADSWINMAWDLDEKDRAECADRARKQLIRAARVVKYPLEQFLSGLTRAELTILDGDYTTARRDLTSLLNHRYTRASPRAATLRPGAYCLLARLAKIQGDMTRMITNLSRAIADSMQYPDALQELVVVNYALDLIRRCSVEVADLHPLFEAMVMMLEAKDWYTGRDHSKFVAGYAVRLWQEWAPAESKKFTEDDIYWAAYLHDIGKIRLPRSLLNKIAPLCSDEWELLHRHPTHGQEILEELKVPLMAQWVAEHHQNAEGSGYPGSEPASPMGMCIAIGDIIEAATSPNRRYKKSKSIPMVLKEIRDCGESKYPLSLLNALSCFENDTRSRFNPSPMS